MAPNWITRPATALLGLLVALCGGALWPVVALVTSSDAPWMAFAPAASALLATTSLALGSPLLRALTAALYTSIGIAYGQFLIAAGVVAGGLGVPIRSALVDMGPELAFALAWARNRGPALWLMLAAIVIAALVAAWMGRRPRGATGR
jgi:hypothetical protein